jgi:uncharacterized protein YdbL (DUF1318 family)
MDARYPERYLTDRRVCRLSDAEHRAYVLALVWSVSNRTDGIIAVEDLETLPRGVTREMLEGLKRAGLVSEEQVAGDLVWLLTDYAETQTTRAELESLDAARRAKRQDMAERRARKASDALSAVEPTTQDRTGTGQDSDRQGQARTKSLPAKRESESSWPVVSIPRSESLPAAVNDSEPF